MINSTHLRPQEMDMNCDGALDYVELCTMLRKFDFYPRIHVTMSDYDVITQVVLTSEPEYIF
jgi:hypothetical protein